MHLISISCVAVLVIGSISHVVFLTESQFWHYLLNKIFWQNKMLFRPTIPSFFQPETWNTHIIFFGLMHSYNRLVNSCQWSIKFSIYCPFSCTVFLFFFNLPCSHYTNALYLGPTVIPTMEIFSPYFLLKYKVKTRIIFSLKPETQIYFFWPDINMNDN